MLNQPPPPPQPGQTAGELGPTAAQDLLLALSDLSGSQSILTSVWLDYYATRMRLAREMGVMQLDETGLWIDQPLSTAAQLKPEEVPLPPPLPPNVAEQLKNAPAPPTPPAPPQPSPEKPNIPPPPDASLPATKP